MASKIITACAMRSNLEKNKTSIMAACKYDWEKVGFSGGPVASR
jgi:hypothetical protein